MRVIPNLKFDAQVLDHCGWERRHGDAEFLPLRLWRVVLAVGMVGGKLAAGEDFKGLGAKAEFLIHALVIRSGEERHADFEINFVVVDRRGVAFAESFAADAVSAARPLLQHRRIPREIVMHDMTTMAMQVNAFLPDGRANQHFWQERRVEPVENAVARVRHVAAAALHQRDELLIAQAGGFVERAAGGAGVVD